MEIKTKTYKCGLRLITSYEANKKSSCVNLNFFVGSQNESSDKNGISHMLEHMMFKESNKRTSEQILKECESLGAAINAYTNTYQTVYYANSLAEKMEACLEVFTDAIFNSKFSEKAFESEKKVVLEEIGIKDDKSKRICFENLMVNVYKGTELENNVLGTKESVSALSIQDVKNYHKKHYLPQNMIVSFVGGISHTEADKYVKKYILSHFKNIQAKPKLFCQEKNLIHKTNFKIIPGKKDNKQTYVLIGYPIFNIASKKQTEYMIISNILGIGMSSKLFLKLREQLGLVYSINAYDQSFEKYSLFLIQYSTNPDNEEKAVAAIKEVLQQIITEGVSEQELEKAKTIFKTIITFNQESSVNFCRKLMYKLLTENKAYSIERQFSEIEKITAAQINKVLREIFVGNECACAFVTTNPKPEIYEPLRKL